jgi:hypothetical protein
MFGAIGLVSPKELGSYVGAPDRVGQTAVASLAPALWRRHSILLTAPRADFRKFSVTCGVLGE